MLLTDPDLRSFDLHINRTWGLYLDHPALGVIFRNPHTQQWEFHMTTGRAEHVPSARIVGRIGALLEEIVHEWTRMDTNAEGSGE